MSASIESQLARYADWSEQSTAPVNIDEVVDRRVPPPPRTSRYRVLVASSAAVLFLACIGAVKWAHDGSAPMTSPRSATHLVAGELNTSLSPSQVSGEIVSLDPLRLSIGASDGVRVGLPVVSNAGLIGKVESVTNDESLVLAVSDVRYVVQVELTRGDDPIVSPNTGWVAAGKEPAYRCCFAQSANLRSPTCVSGTTSSRRVGHRASAPHGIPVGRVTAVVEGVDGSPAPRLEAEPHVVKATETVSVLLD